MRRSGFAPRARRRRSRPAVHGGLADALRAAGPWPSEGGAATHGGDSADDAARSIDRLPDSLHEVLPFFATALFTTAPLASFIDHGQPS